MSSCALCVSLWAYSVLGGFVYRRQSRVFVIKSGVAGVYSLANKRDFDVADGEVKLSWPGLAGARSTQVFPLCAPPNYHLPLWMPFMLCLIPTMKWWGVHVRHPSLRFVVAWGFALAGAFLVLCLEVALLGLLVKRRTPAFTMTLLGGCGIALFFFAATAGRFFAMFTPEPPVDSALPSSETESDGE
ncbi:MAG: hypothetical protein H6817_02365 [Phycisphaerales bacterium]|nr:hypothetical protein [Phycisphaerales bacterium]